MKSLKIIALALGLVSFTLNSCKEKKTEAEEIIENAKENGVEVKEKASDDGYKLKVENADGSEIKIKVEEDGEVKVKTDD